MDLNNDKPSDNLIVPLKERIITPLGENVPVPSHLTEGWVADCEHFPDLTENEVYKYLLLSNRTFESNQQY